MDGHRISPRLRPEWPSLFASHVVEAADGWIPQPLVRSQNAHRRELQAAGDRQSLDPQARAVFPFEGLAYDRIDVYDQAPVVRSCTGRPGALGAAQQLSMLASLPTATVTSLIPFGAIHATIGLALALGTALLVANGLAWRIVSATLDRERVPTGS